MWAYSRADGVSPRPQEPKLHSAGPPSPRIPIPPSSHGLVTPCFELLVESAASAGDSDPWSQEIGTACAGRGSQAQPGLSSRQGRIRGQ